MKSLKVPSFLIAPTSLVLISGCMADELVVVLSGATAPARARRSMCGPFGRSHSTGRRPPTDWLHPNASFFAID
jgi:hypothetical protein